MKSPISTLVLVLLTVAGTTVAGCGSNAEDNITEPPVTQWTLQIGTEQGEGTTRALTLGGAGGYKTMTCSWAEGEKVYVYKSTGGASPAMTHVGTLKAQSSGSSVTLSGTLTGVFSLSDELFLYTQPLSNTFYSGQNGVLEKLASDYDLMYDKVIVTGVNPETHTITTGNAIFKAMRSICRFVLKDKLGNDLKPTQLTMTGVGLVTGYNNNWEPIFGSYETPSSLTFTLDGTRNVIFLSLSDFYSDTSRPKTAYTFTAKVGSDTYSCTKNAALNNGKYYSTTLSMTKQ